VLRLRHGECGGGNDGRDYNNNARQPHPHKERLNIWKQWLDEFLPNP
jgi:hypothetical protein